MAAKQQLHQFFPATALAIACTMCQSTVLTAKRNYWTAHHFLGMYSEKSGNMHGDVRLNKTSHPTCVMKFLSSINPEQRNIPKYSSTMEISSSKYFDKELADLTPRFINWRICNCSAHTADVFDVFVSFSKREIIQSGTILPGNNGLTFLPVHKHPGILLGTLW